MSETHAITVEKVLPYPAERIWRTLTTSGEIAKWLMPNDFTAEVGRRFTFRTAPMGDWDGVVHCEVLDCDPPRLLRYSWTGGSDSNPAYGSKLHSMVTWTLTPVEGGTHLRFVHDGFVFPGNRFAFDAMGPGWGRAHDSIARVTAERVA
ncbi:SRPBCC domain-containing protein [Bradyrhizobium jicamae]|uniref:SRPBCC domain-containing protein n=1 Tax=Bradyrhizobium jicamae TaxID=280332 RepID=A0ABS5FRV9_9BRAD|nr:SRPBCC domain-containing protein [Bradyrhizobium jicamae]MBR0799534.1 SRPBCC domain-containing protein [Bradyrhizobium jicamae]MBR0937019.1 SRPBCC domain-containing protein [Bradyrhizobium jicamae]